MIFQITINLVTAAVAVAVIGAAALCVYVWKQNIRAGDETFDPEWMDPDKCKAIDRNNWRRVK